MPWRLRHSAGYFQMAASGQIFKYRKDLPIIIDVTVPVRLLFKSLALPETHAPKRGGEFHPRIWLLGWLDWWGGIMKKWLFIIAMDKPWLTYSISMLNEKKKQQIRALDGFIPLDLIKHDGRLFPQMPLTALCVREWVNPHRQVEQSSSATVA